MTATELRYWLLRVVLCALLVVPGALAVAQTYEEGLVAFDKGDFRTAAKFWEPLADAGNARAQHGLGMLYEAGQGVPQDYARAAEFYGRAAAQGEIASANNLALMYADGRGVPQDFGQAIRLWRVAADAGHPMAQFNLGLTYYRGAGLPAPDYNEAAWWFAKSAEGGSVDAQFAMGEMFALGLGVLQNLAEAERWYRLAAGGGQRAAAERLAAMQAGTFPPASGSPPSAPADPMATAVPPAAPDSAPAEAVVDPETAENAEADAVDEAEASAGDGETGASEVADETETETAAPAPDPQLDSSAPIAAAPAVQTYAPALAAEGVTTTATAPAASPEAAGSAAGETAVLPAEGAQGGSTEPVAATAEIPATEAGVPENAGAPENPELPVAPAPAEPAAIAADGSAATVAPLTYLLLGQSPSPEAALQRWNGLQTAYPGELGPLTSKFVPRGDGSVLLLAGPVDSAASGQLLCNALAVRDPSIQCYVVTN